MTNQMLIPIKAVVVTMFDADTGDRSGEFRTWVEQLPLPEKIRFPQGYRDLRYNPEKGVLGIVTGVGTARAAASIMALGMDPRFDLSRAYCRRRDRGSQSERGVDRLCRLGRMGG